MGTLIEGAGDALDALDAKLEALFARRHEVDVAAVEGLRERLAALLQELETAFSE